jgi:hypothetical protein
MSTRQTVNAKSNRTSYLLAAALLIGSAAVAGAQETQLASSDGRWTAWVGCWQASGRDATTLTPDKPLPTVCIVPVAGNATVDLITVNGTTATSERVDANGNRRSINREGCNGWETASFSGDSKRIYLRSEYQCTGNRTRTSTGIMSMSPNGEWLDVQGVRVEANNGVRVVHYGRVPTPPAVSAEARAAMERQGTMATSIAVIAASDSVRLADVVDASKHVDPLVVQTWLAQRGQGFNLDAKRLTQLADAKVAPNVIDVMIALSYPQTFALNLAQADGQIVQTSGPRQVASEEVLGDGPIVFMNWDPLYSSTYGYGYGMYGYRNGLGYHGYYPDYWYGRGPVVITRPSQTVDVPRADTRGKMVRGSGYTRPDDRRDGGSSGTPRSSTSGGSGSGSAGSGSSSSGSSGSSEPRTAKPRSP